MILVDYSGSMFSAIHVELARNPGAKCDIKFLRHCLLNQLRSYYKKFKEDYGEMVICLEGGSCWRKEIFPNYKAGRAKARIDSGIDWEEVFKNMNQITDELREVTPWKFMQIKGLEADDVIAILARNMEKIGRVNLFEDVEKTVIVSNDKDYAQLQKLPWISQYLPRKGTTSKEMDPEHALIDLIVHGDKADGIPNINSNINSFVDGARQKPVSRDLMSGIFSSGTAFLTESQKTRYKENETLISFDCIPEEYVEKVLDVWKESRPKGGGMKLFTYLAKNGLKEQLARIDDFKL